nr:hypothetical protein CFP56_11289 [Quercus suber]
MAPIPVHIDAPIAPKNASAITPQTESSAASAYTSGAASTTRAPTSDYPAAQPGQAAGSTPTTAVSWTQPSPTRTSGDSTQQDGNPPAPQPGSVPTPMIAAGQEKSLPPPPRSGQPPVTTMPAQLQISSPYQNLASTHSTATNAAQQLSSRMRPTTLNMGPVGSPVASGPLGYQQNAYAQDLSPAQRASLDQQEHRESFASGGLMNNLGLGGGDKTLGGGLTETMGFQESGAAATAGDMWNSVKGWASAAGEKLAETEKAVWERVNKG